VRSRIHQQAAAQGRELQPGAEEPTVEIDRGIFGDDAQEQASGFRPCVEALGVRRRRPGTRFVRRLVAGVALAPLGLRADFLFGAQARVPALSGARAELGRMDRLPFFELILDVDDQPG